MTGLGVNGYADELVSVLIFHQITLMTVVSPLLLVGSPGRLLLRSARHVGVERHLLRVAHAGLRSRMAGFALHPVVAIVIAAVMVPALYLTDLVSVTMRTPFEHSALLVVFLATGLVAAIPLWSPDPLPRKPSYMARLVDVFVEIQIHAAFGLVLLLSGTVLFSRYATPPMSWQIDPVGDQAIAGALLWTYAALPLLLVLIVTLSKWRVRDLQKASQHQDRNDAELERYNAYLATLDSREPVRPRGSAPIEPRDW